MIRSTRGCASKASTARCRTVRPARSTSCLGTGPPNRSPRPPAAMMAVTYIGCDEAELYRASGVRGELPSVDVGRDDRVDALGENLRVLNRRRVERRRLDG